MKLTLQNYIKRYLLLLNQSNDLNKKNKTPTINQLAIKFNCNRHTVRAVFSSLENNNIVTKIAGKGYFWTNKIFQKINPRNFVNFNSIKTINVPYKDAPLSVLISKNVTIFKHKYFYGEKLAGISYIYINRNKEIFQNSKIPKEVDLLIFFAFYGIVIAKIKTDINSKSNSFFSNMKAKKLTTISHTLYNENKEGVAIIKMYIPSESLHFSTSIKLV